MALLARFVGIDDDQDAGTRDLTGAVRDATAMWALFYWVRLGVWVRMEKNPGASSPYRVRNNSSVPNGAISDESSRSGVARSYLRFRESIHR
jgi:hypothetical protein